MELANALAYCELEGKMFYNHALPVELPLERITGRPENRLREKTG
jgi:hypothetical protein